MDCWFSAEEIQLLVNFIRKKMMEKDVKRADRWIKNIKKYSYINLLVLTENQPKILAAKY